MAWVRYDDNFEHHAKTTAAVLMDPGAPSLHLLANTWTAKTKTPGYVPRHQPGALLCDRATGEKWAQILVSVKLWHDVNDMCDRCADSYTDLPAGADGYVFHDHEVYRPPARERQTPGTPTEISAKRQAAGRRGGKATAARRAQIEQEVANPANGLANPANGKQTQQTPAASEPIDESATEIDELAQGGLFESPESDQIKQPVRAKAANAASKTSKAPAKRVSPEPEPVPVASYEANTTSPSVGDATASRPPGKSEKPASKNASAIVAAFIDGGKQADQDSPTSMILNKVGRDAKRLIGEKVDFDKLLLAADRMGRGGWSNLDIQLQRLSAERVGATARDQKPDGRTVSTEEDLNKWDAYQ